MSCVLCLSCVRCVYVACVAAANKHIYMPGSVDKFRDQLCTFPSFSRAFVLNICIVRFGVYRALLSTCRALLGVGLVWL